ncbi:hypothetical protein I3842_05G028600 [Carya illinoinensis]|uniref:Uncharacterized protein n=1 Tax=Carya illinoinensis TaxID=32201 RepID=A0A922EZA5_CARIL|nr:hypothetical protein I3842_05G028600 [Carya illinoinensis]
MVSFHPNHLQYPAYLVSTQKLRPPSFFLAPVGKIYNFFSSVHSIKKCRSPTYQTPLTAMNLMSICWMVEQIFSKE